MYFNRTLGNDSRGFVILKLLARLSYRKFLVTLLITISLFIDRAYSAPPPLPSPTLPQLENEKVNKHKEDSQETDSLMKEIQQFMPSKKTDDQVPEPIKPASTPQNTSNEASKEEGETDSFIDLGNNKLPILDNTLYDKKINNPKKSDQLDKIPSQKIELEESSKNNNNNINNNSPILPPTENQNIESQDTVPLKPIESPILPKPQIAGDQIDSLSGDNKSDIEVTTTIIPPVTMPDKEKNQVELPQIGSEDNKGVVTPNLDIAPSSQEKKPTEPQAADPIIPALPKENTEPKMTEPAIVPVIPKAPPVSVTPQAQTAVPVFVKDNKPSEQSSKVVEERAVNNKQPDKSTPIAKSATITIKEISPEMALFIEDEKQMLFLPDDDIVLGELTEEARLNQMAMYAFIQMFKRIYDSEHRENQRKIINRFIDNYNRDVHITNSIVNDATDRAFEAVSKNNLFTLRVLLDNYLIIQKRGDDNYTLLHESAETGNYYIAKFLIMRGVNIKATDYHYRTALEISDEQNNNVSCLIRKATAN
ncbi:MAG: hypothetical protein LN575_01680 [Rickettsia endosymbiont of Gnoriste bilineata]|nr:hypothetical protein [Rickettsia endosymbiont of Gnoriste bilineata]